MTSYWKGIVQPIVFCSSFLTVIMLLLFRWMEIEPATPEALRKSNQEALLSKAHEISQNLVYFRDDRTGLCYAFFWKGTVQGSPVLTVVPCENVKHLLINPPAEELEEK